MTYNRVCPKCTSWRLQGIETGTYIDRLLNVLNLGLYRCRDCDWQGLLRSKGKENLIRGLPPLSIWKKISYIFLMLTGIYVVSILSIMAIGKYASRDQTSPAPETKIASAINAEATYGNRPSDKAAAAPVKTETAVSVPQTPPAAPVEKIKVIGNRDSKRYHLPGMKYYQLVEAYHRVEFSSEDEAIKAGYHKASTEKGVAVRAAAVTAASGSQKSPAAPVQKGRVIGNRDSKRYHLPGMKYYHQVEAHHRVIFSSEAEAIKKGYHKAQQ